MSRTKTPVPGINTLQPTRLARVFLGHQPNSVDGQKIEENCEIWRKMGLFALLVKIGFVDCVVVAAES